LSGPNGFARYFNGSIASHSAALDIRSAYEGGNFGSIAWKITNLDANSAEITVLDAYSGREATRFLEPGKSLAESLRLDEFFGWYDLIVTVAGDAAFKYRLAGHVETGRDSFSDPALRGLVTLKG
jgi:phospholipase C